MSLWDLQADPQPKPSRIPKDIDSKALAEIVHKMLNDPERKAALEKRLAPFRTKVTWKTLMTLLD